MEKIDIFQLFFSFTSNTLATTSVTEEKNPILRSKLEICQIFVSIPFLEMFALFEFLGFQRLEQNRRLSSQIAPRNSNPADSEHVRTNKADESR